MRGQIREELEGQEREDRERPCTGHYAKHRWPFSGRRASQAGDCTGKRRNTAATTHCSRPLHAGEYTAEPYHDAGSRFLRTAIPSSLPSKAAGGLHLSL